MTTKATTQQVRSHFKADGYEVRISKDGHVTFRKPDGMWLEGRWVSEYVITDGIIHLQ